MLVLGIESSCDETAAAIVEDGQVVLSNVVASQVKIHRSFGGVVPELASREHLRNISYVVRQAFQDAGKTQEDIDGIAVTQGPGLIGSLLVGVSYAKAMAFSIKKPLVPVNHIEGHIFSAFIENPQIEFPLLALVVSGGHTSLIYSLEPVFALLFAAALFGERMPPLSLAGGAAIVAGVLISELGKVAPAG